MTTRASVSLSETPGAPYIPAALCTEQGWNGFHVPYLAAEDLVRHYAALAAFEPEQGWAEVMVTEDDEQGEIRMHACEAGGCVAGQPHETGEDYVWSVQGWGAFIDGLIWSSPIAIEQVA